MAKEMEHSSSTSTCTEELEAVDTSPSYKVSLHRICGWALESVIDKVSQQSKRQPMEPECVEMLRILHLLKLPNDQKIHLPDAVQYLDRGGLTFMRMMDVRCRRENGAKLELATRGMERSCSG